MGQQPKPLTEHVSARHFFGAELRWWRERRGLSQPRLGALVIASGATIGKIEKAERWPTPDLAARADAALDTGGVLGRLMPLVRTEQQRAARAGRSDADGHPSGGKGFEVDRRSLLRIVALPVGWPGPEDGTRPEGPEALAERVTRLHRNYQRGRYRKSMNDAPALLSSLTARTAQEPSERHTRRMLAEAYQVAASLLLKTDEPHLAAVAAVRSMAAAEECEDPLTVASSTRALVHTALSVGDHQQAVAIAVAASDRLARDADHRCVRSRSLRGALLLRAALATARLADRQRTHELLDQATALAGSIGRDANAHWTGFGPTNVVQHRVAAAVELGDAGTAVDLAAGIDIAGITLPERRAVLCLDTARALLQWGRHAQAYAAIRQAEEHAPDEIRLRRSTHRLVRDLAETCPVTMRPRIQAYARLVGAR